MSLPDFLQLSSKDVKREKERQTRLKQEFNSRARQTPPEMEAARALIIEDSLRDALKNESGEERNRIKNQLSENLAQQGRFLEASQTAHDGDLKQFFEKAADAVFNREKCDCAGKIKKVAGVRLQMPKSRVIKEIYSIKEKVFGFLVECASCENWYFTATNPMPAPIAEKGFNLKMPNDLQRLKV